MTTDLSIFKLVMDASLVVKLVMTLLVMASLMSWTLIMLKSGKLSSMQRNTTRFEDRFWSGVSLNSLYEELSQQTTRQGLERIFYDGFHEYKRALGTDPASRLSVSDSVQRAMRVAASKEVDELEQNLAFLATVGYTSPYIGLFGTVWGIMNSFISLGQLQQATLGVVAPGIAEALIATAIGLFAAIPAVIAYNRFSDKIDRLTVSYDNFREEFTALLERHAAQRKPA